MTDDAQPAAAAQAARLSEAEITALRAYHRRSAVNPWCRDAGCKQDWPCHTARLIVTLDATRADLQQACAERDQCRAAIDEHIHRCPLMQAAWDAIGDAVDDLAATTSPTMRGAGTEPEAWAVEYVAVHPEVTANRCRHAGCQGPPMCRCCNSMMVDLDLPDDCADQHTPPDRQGDGSSQP